MAVVVPLEGVGGGAATFAAVHSATGPVGAPRRAAAPRGCVVGGHPAWATMVAAADWAAALDGLAAQVWALRAVVAVSPAGPAAACAARAARLTRAMLVAASAMPPLPAGAVTG